MSNIYTLENNSNNSIDKIFVILACANVQNNNGAKI